MAPGSNISICFGGGTVEWQDTRVEILVDHGIEGQPQPVAALPFGQDRDAREQFGFGDGRKE